MSVTELKPRSSALARVVATAKKMEEHEEFDRWQFADDVAEAVDELANGENGFDRSDRDKAGRGSADTGFFRALDQVNDAVSAAGVVTVGRGSIRGAYGTAKAWPPEIRVEGANYWAHYELQGQAYNTRRQQILQRLVKLHKGTVSTPQVRLWKSNSKPADLTPRDQKLENKLRSALRSWASPQKFTQLHQDEQQAAQTILRNLAGEIARGDFA